MSIHPTAQIGSQAIIGDNTQIGAYAVIEDNVIIGNDCKIMNHVSILDGARIGNQVHIHQGAVISGIPQDLKFSGENTICEIGDRTIIRECVTINRGTNDTFKTTIGADNLIMAYVHAAHDVVTEDKVIIANGVQMGGHCTICYHATVGGLSPIHQFVRIGAHSFVGGGLRVSKDVPPYILAMGEPLAYGGLNKVGLERRGFNPEIRGVLRQAYKIIFRSTLSRHDALQQVSNEFGKYEEIIELLTFFETSDRGVLGGVLRR